MPFELYFERHREMEDIKNKIEEKDLVIY